MTLNMKPTICNLRTSIGIAFTNLPHHQYLAYTQPFDFFHSLKPLSLCTIHIQHFFRHSLPEGSRDVAYLYYGTTEFYSDFCFQYLVPLLPIRRRNFPGKDGICVSPGSYRCLCTHYTHDMYYWNLKKISEQTKYSSAFRYLHKV